MKTKQRIAKHVPAGYRQSFGSSEPCSGSGYAVENLAVNGTMAECPTCRRVVKTTPAPACEHSFGLDGVCARCSFRAEVR